MDWNVYRRMMNGEISPAAAVARSRHGPAGALDAALPRRRARDQNGGRLDGSYVRATAEYLRAAGLAQEDLDRINEILDQYVEEAPAEDAENLKMREDPKIRVGGPRGTVGSMDAYRLAADRRMSLDQFDQFGRPRSQPATPMAPGGAGRGFHGRFPEAGKIRVL
jgi:hypothetical protein